MSEYQYYEFQAIDKPLNDQQMKELRALTSRGEITRSSLINVYHFGNFKGDRWRMMEKYFDAFLYVTNWGSQTLMLKIPKKLLSPQVVANYASTDKHAIGLSYQAKSESVILCFNVESESEKWEQDDEQMPSLIPLRSEIMKGDLRALYLGWLLQAQTGELDDDDSEPTVPEGLKDLTPALEALVDFLCLDRTLLQVASTNSDTRQKNSRSAATLKQKLKEIPNTTKEEWLMKLLKDDELNFKVEILRKLYRNAKPPNHKNQKSRTVKELLFQSEQILKP